MAGTLATGIDPLDEDGGLPAGSLVHVHGPPAAGKTTLGLVLARERAPSALVLPEQPLETRMADVLGDAMDRVLVARPEGYDGQAQAVETAAGMLRSGRVGCVVVDSLTFLYRFERLSDTEALQGLFDQVRRLRAAARAGDGLAVVTNQVRGAGDGYAPLGGPALGHAADVELALEPLEGTWRGLRLAKHPSRPSGAFWEVRIGDDGLA